MAQVCITGIIFAGYECCIAALLFLSLATVRHSNPYDYADSIQKCITPEKPLAYRNILSLGSREIFTLHNHPQELFISLHQDSTGTSHFV